MTDHQIFTDSHAKSILTTMNNLRKTRKLCDVMLKVQGQDFPAHRIVLAACSDYFCAMFTNNMSEKDQSEVELHEISASVVEVLLEFVYTETVNVTIENVQELLPAACLLQLNGVKHACSTFLQKQLDYTNSLGIKIFAEQHSCEDLSSAAESFCLRHFEEVVEQEEFRSLPVEEVGKLICSDELRVNSEEPVYEAVIKWVKHDVDSRSSHLPKLLKHVRLPLLTAKYITDVVDAEVLVKRCHECRDLLDEAKKFHLRPDLRTQMTGQRLQPRSGYMTIGCAVHILREQFMLHIGNPVILPLKGASGKGTDYVLVVIGGFGAHQNMVEAVEQYSPKTKEWTQLPNLSRRRRYVSAAAMGSKLYVIGGYDGQARLDTVECLDLSAEELVWKSVTPMSNRRGLAGVTVYKGMLYVCGGFDGYTRHSSMERYYPSLDQWETVGGLAVGREGMGLVVAGDCIYCIGGYDGINLLETAEKYDIITEEFSTLAPMSTKRSGAGVAVINDTIYVCGGYDGFEHLSSVECYNVHTGHWTSLRHMKGPRCYVGACVLRGKLLVVAGYDGNTLLSSVESYDPLTDTWETLEESMSTQRCDAGVAVVQKT